MKRDSPVRRSTFKRSAGPRESFDLPQFRREGRGFATSDSSQLALDRAYGFEFVESVKQGSDSRKPRL